MESEITLGQEFVNMSVSWGTMKEDDVYNALMGFLGQYDTDTANRIKEEYSNLLDEEGNLKEAVTEKDQCEISYLINESLWDAMNSIAPDGCYFGASEGDGSDYGFWAYGNEFDEEGE